MPTSLEENPGNAVWRWNWCAGPLTRLVITLSTTSGLSYNLKQKMRAILNYQFTGATKLWQ
jgi:hypothetical protein